MDEARLIRIMGGEEQGLRAGALRLGLSALCPGYRAAVAVRNALFDRGVRRPADLGRPVVSVGNLTTGGTGKTPMVIEFARRLATLGHRPAVLMRGYAGHNGDSDEARELRAALGGMGVIVEPDPDRAAAAERVLARDAGVAAFVLDDGFQHRQVGRDLDIVLVDATRPFGFDRLLPRGLLREPPAALRRAHGVIITRADRVDATTLAALDDRVRSLHGRPILAHAAMQWTGVREYDHTLGVEALASLRVVGVCGIANPGPFERALSDVAGEVAASLCFPDHHAYGITDWQLMLRVMHDTRSDALVVTEKDWVKLHAMAPGADTVRVLRPVLSLRFLTGEDRVELALGGMFDET
jgi:tetraacyldisaccharide 4'-kinase